MHRERGIRLLIVGCGALAVAIALQSVGGSDLAIGARFGAAIGLLSLAVFVLKRSRPSQVDC